MDKRIVTICILAIVLAAGCFTTLFAQTDSSHSIKLVCSIANDVSDFTIDNLGNIYLVKSNNQIKKLNDKGDSIGIYNDIKRYGNISSIDATNPLKLIVFYKDFSTIAILDRFLNYRNRIDLRSQNMPQIKLVTNSYDNNYWLYDELENKIKKIDDNGSVLLESADLRQALETVPSPVAMFDKDGQLYLYDSLVGLLIFDYYGAKKNTLQLLHLQDIQVIDKNTITGRDLNHIILYKPATLQWQSFNIIAHQELYKKILFSGDKVYCLTQTGIVEIYKFVK